MPDTPLLENNFLDHNATAPLAPEVADAMYDCLIAGLANPASQHAAGRFARRRLEEARQTVARILGAKTTGMDADKVIFTSGGTESNNMALRGIAARAAQDSRHIVISPIEHPSIAVLAEQLVREGYEVDRLPIDSAGIVSVDALSDLIRPDTRLVSVMLGNNETGVVEPIQGLAAVCHAQGVPLHTDAVQCVGKVPVDFTALGASAMSATAHKFHGPLGIGVLIVRHDTVVDPLLVGGFQQAGMRAGTEPVALAVGMAAALELYQREANARFHRMTELRNQFESLVLKGVSEAQVIAADVERLPHTSNIAFIGFDRQALAMALDTAGVACSTGSACASGSSEPSPVLLAMGCDLAVVRGSLRFSVGAFTTIAEITQAAERICLCCTKLRHAN